MKIIVSIIVYNRYSNLDLWLKCWKECDQTNALLIVIHTGDEIEKFKTLCDKNGAWYIHRENIGIDIGSMQDVFKERLKGFPNDWDYLLWVTDDTLPMSRDFLKSFIETIQKPGIGIACMQISKSVKPHVRTTGFMIAKETSKNIKFPADPVTTKSHCYFFEHRGGPNTLTEQVRAMGLDCVMVSDVKTSPLWDSMHPNAKLRLDRQSEFNKTWGIGDKVTFICTIYNSYPQIISSLILQTHKNWELILIHDGPSSNGMLGYIGNDPRIKYIETKERRGNWGHYYRQWALKEFELSDYVVITNADNYYTPVFIEYMLKGFIKGAIATYCSEMVHSYKAWQTIPCKLQRGYLDSGGVMVKSNIAKEIGWRDIESHSSDFTYFSDIAAKYNWKNFIPVKGNLFVHN